MYLFQIQVGPVQSFIRSARRTRDFWFGSRFLSAVSREIAKTVADEFSLEALIFPSPLTTAQLNDPNFLVANKIVASISSDPSALAAQCQQTVRSFVSQEWEATEVTFLQKWSDDPLSSAKLDLKAARQQVNELVELVWTACVYTPETYQQAWQQLTRVMLARKATTSFTQIPWSAQRHKSSLDGRYDAVIDWKVAPTAAKSGVRYGLKRGEFLSGIDLLKRFGMVDSTQDGANPATPTPINFPSTSHMAALPFFERLEHLAADQRDKLKSTWQKYIDDLPRSIRDDNDLSRARVELTTQHSIFGNYDGSLLFAERLVDSFDTEKNAPQSTSLLQKAQGALQEFLRATSREIDPVPRPLPYYAILQADGDHMGRLLRTCTTIEQHRAISQALGTFAGKVQPIVAEDHHGALIYAGGDDVVALLPVHTALACANALQQAFSNALKIVLEQHQLCTMQSPPPSLSVGVLVVHHLEPLSAALEQVVQAEQLAKHERNSLAVTVNKRNGMARSVVGRWDRTSPELPTLFERLNTFRTWLRNDQLPDGYAFELYSLLQRMNLQYAATEAEAAAWRDIQRVEAIRILKHKKTPVGQNVPEEVINGLSASINLHTQRKQFGLEAEATFKDDAPFAYSLNQLALELIVARMFAEVDRLVEGY